MNKCSLIACLIPFGDHPLIRIGSDAACVIVTHANRGVSPRNLHVFGVCAFLVRRRRQLSELSHEVVHQYICQALPWSCHQLCSRELPPCEKREPRQLRRWALHYSYLRQKFASPPQPPFLATATPPTPFCNDDTKHDDATLGHDGADFTASTSARSPPGLGCEIS